MVPALTESVSRSEKELVVLAREGNQKAFYRLFSLHEKRVYALSYGLLKDVREAESLTKKIFLNAFRRLNDLRDDAAFSTFISRSLWEAVLRFKCTSRETSSSPVELAASKLPEASVTLTQLEA